MGWFMEKNIGRITFLSSVLLVVLLTLVLGAFFLRDKYRHYQVNLQRVERNFTQLQQERLRSEVLMQITRIESRRQDAQRQLEQNIKSRVNEAHAVADNLHHRLGAGASREELAVLVSEALRPIRFNDGRGYFFVRTLDGDSLLYPPDPGREGKNVFASSSPRHQELFNRMIGIARNKGEGFIRYQWPKPEQPEEELNDKVSYIRYFEPLDCIIGSGEYLDDFETMGRRDIIRHLNSLVPDLKFPDYVFVYHLHKMEGGVDFATMVVNPNRPDLVGKKIADHVVDSRGRMFRHEMLAQIRGSGEAFVTYWYKKPGSAQPVAKMSYFKYYPEWDWIVAKGTYFDQLDRRLTTMRLDLRHEIKATVLYLLLFLVFTCLVFLGLSYFMSRGIYNIFADYKLTQQKQRQELKRMNRALQVQAATDPLTGLFNRGRFSQALGRETARAGRYNNSLSLILFDIDFFKQVNDTHGHLVGDEVLKELGKLCQQVIREQDLLARWGGEEFIVLAPETDLDGAARLAEKLRQAIASHVFSAGISVRCSFGVASFVPGETGDNLVNRADQALYTAKAQGRDQVVTAP